MQPCLVLLQVQRPRLLHWLAPAIVAATTCLKLRGDDLWSHIRVGQWIWEHGLSGEDVFAHTSEGWRYTDAGGQLLLYAIHATGGVPGLLATTVALSFATAFLVGAISRELIPVTSPERDAAASLMVGIWGAASVFRLHPRPELFAMPLFAALVWVLTRAGRTRHLVVWLALIALVWGNLHRSATMVPAIVGMAAMTWWRRDRDLAKRFGLGALVTLAALLLNPGGLTLLTSSVKVLLMQDRLAGVAEWQSIDSIAFLIESVPWFGVAAGFFAIAGWRARVLRWDVLVAAGLTLFAFDNVRFIPYAVLAMAPTLALFADLALGWLAARARPALAHALAVVVSCAMPIGWTMHLFGVPGSSPHYGVGIADWRVPVDAAKFLGAHPPPGKMWNSFNLGGYLLFALGPEQKVFIDGRGEMVYAPAFTEETLAAQRDPAIMRVQFEKYGVGYAVLEYAGLIDARYTWLDDRSDWILVYWDDLCAILVHHTAQSDAYVGRFGMPHLKLSDTLLRLSEPAGGTEDEALRLEVLRNVKRAPRSMRAHFMAALAHKNASRAREYQRERDAVARLARERNADVPLP